MNWKRFRKVTSLTPAIFAIAFCGRRSTDAVDPARCVDRGGDDCLDGPPSDEALLQRFLADEAGLVLDGTREAHQRRDAIQGSDRLGKAPLAGTRMARMPLELSHAVEFLSFPEGDRVPARVLVREGDDCRQSGGTGDVASRGAGPREPIVLFDRVGGPFWPFIDRTLADHKAAGIADKLAARVVTHEVLAAAFGTDPVFFDHRIRRRRGWHGLLPLPAVGLRVPPNITRLYYTLSLCSVTTCW